MHLSSILPSLIVTLSFAVGIHAWTQAPDGTWVANENHYQLPDRFGDIWIVAEACTYQNTNYIPNNGDACAFWVNGEGVIHHGKWAALAVPGRWIVSSSNFYDA